MTRTTLSRTLATSLAATLAATLAASALAAAALAGEDTIIIDVSDVDFTDPSEVAALYEEVVEASEAVCEAIYIDGMGWQVGYSTRLRMYDECVAVTLEDAIEDAELQTLSETHASRDLEAFEIAAQ